MTEALVRQCPSCKKNFVKADGCNKMVVIFRLNCNILILSLILLGLSLWNNNVLRLPTEN